MGVMSPVWEGLRSSRMALLAVNALLLGTTSNCGVTAAVVAAVPSWDAGGHMMSLGRSIATLPRTLTAASPRRGGRIEPRGKLGRRRDDESDETGCDCKPNRSAGQGSRTALHGKRQHAASSAATPTTTTTNRDRHVLLSRRLLDGSRGTPPQKESMWRKVLVPRASAAAAAAVAASSAGNGAISQQQQQPQREQQPSLGSKAFSLRRLRKRGGAISSSAGPDDRSQQQHKGAQQQQQQQQNQHNDKQGSPSVSTTTTAAATAASRPAILASDLAAARAVTASTSTAAASASLSPTPSYLRWPKSTDTRQTTGSKPNRQLDRETRLRKKGQQLLSLGAGSRNGRTDSERVDSARTSSVTISGAGGSNSVEKGSLGAAKASRGGGGASAVSLTFKEAMFAGAVSRSLAQTCMQPANVVKTLLQGRGTSSQLSKLSFKLLTRGAGAQFVMSMPHGAFNFATLEVGNTESSILLIV